MRFRYFFVSLFVIAGFAAATAGAATTCTGDLCIVTDSFSDVQAQISASGAPLAVTQLLSSEVALAKRLHPPGPCFAGDLHPPSPCLPSYRYLPSAAMLVLVDAQVRVLGGFTAFGCQGSCILSSAAARSIDGDIRATLADLSIFPPGSPSLPALPSSD